MSRLIELASKRLLDANEAVANARTYRVANREGFYINLDLVLELQHATAEFIQATRTLTQGEVK